MTLNKLYNTPIQKLIRQRYSCRTYKPQALSSDDLAKLTTFVDSCGSGPLGSSLNFQVLAASKEDTNSLKSLGTYGFIKDPAGFVIGTIHDEPHSLADLGYQMEMIILRAFDLGIGSCWLGGTFTKSRFARSIELKDSEIIPAIISIGYPLNQQALIDRLSRIYAGADRRLPWQKIFYQDTFDHPLSQLQSGQFQEPLELLRLAPSASNKQPWRIVQDKNQYHFYLERTKNYPSPIFNKILKLADLQLIDIGIAMSHFELSLKDIGLVGEWVHTDPGLSAQNIEKEYIITWKPQSFS